MGTDLVIGKSQQVSKVCVVESLLSSFKLVPAVSVIHTQLGVAERLQHTRPQKLHHRIYIKAFNYGRPLTHLPTHVILAMACGSNIHTQKNRSVRVCLILLE